MIVDKVCFIHLRNKDDKGNYKQTGGATIAWAVDGETGNITVGEPARCMAADPRTGEGGDIFVKEVGRDIAEVNLIYGKPLFVIEREAYVALAEQQATDALSFNQLTPNAIGFLVNAATSLIRMNPLSVLSSRWFEEVVRAHFNLRSDNRLEHAGEGSQLRLAPQKPHPLDAYLNSLT